MEVRYKGMSANEQINAPFLLPQIKFFTMPQFADQILPEFEDEMARTRAILAAIPNNRFQWRASEDLQTIASNASHLVDIVDWVTFITSGDDFDIAPADGPAFTPETYDSTEAVLNAFDKNVTAARKAICDLPDELVNKPWSLKAGGKAMMTMPKGDCLRKWVLNHAVHHRGILSVYLRLMGVNITPVYDY